MIVLDASVILKWLLPEEGRDIALSFLDKHINDQEEVAIPELLYYEVGNILAVKTKLPEEAIIEVMRYLFDLELSAFTLGQQEYLEAMRLSRLYEVSIYNASYVVLARSLGASFITADERLARKMKDMPFVQTLNSYQEG
jgi:predicted nucleic acid-binding protein